MMAWGTYEGWYDITCKIEINLGSITKNNSGWNYKTYNGYHCCICFVIDVDEGDDNDADSQSAYYITFI